eukprot:COSAG01_NODE_17_length_39991_cov_30.596160_31_plen_98_part_00
MQYLTTCALRGNQHVSTALIGTSQRCARKSCHPAMLVRRVSAPLDSCGQRADSEGGYGPCRRATWWWRRREAFCGAGAGSALGSAGRHREEEASPQL